MRTIDWSVLKKSLIFLLSSLGGGALLVGQSYYFSDSLARQLKKDNAQAQANQAKYFAIEQEEQMLREYYPDFIKIHQSGMIGHERRLDWIDGLKRLGQDIKLPDLSYTIASQEQYIPEFELQHDGYKLYKSSMTLNIGLLHEIDFFHLFTKLDQASLGFYTVSKCNFQASNKISFSKGAANIKTTCVLDWIIMELVSGTILNFN